jgi:uncharacterized membrane protein
MAGERIFPIADQICKHVHWALKGVERQTEVKLDKGVIKWRGNKLVTIAAVTMAIIIAFPWFRYLTIWSMIRWRKS